MHQFRGLSLLFLNTILSASLIPSNMPTSNQLDQGTPQILQPTKLIQPHNQTGSHIGGTTHDIGSNLSVYIILLDAAPIETLYELLLLAKEQVHDRTVLFGPTAFVPRDHANPNVTEVTHAGFKYFIEPARFFSHRYPGLRWGEFEILTLWLYEYLWVSFNRRECNFVLFRLNVTPGLDLNLGFGTIQPLETKMGLGTTSSNIVRPPTEPFSQSNISST